VRPPQSNNINLAPPTVLTADNAASLGEPSPSPQQIGRPYYTGRLNPNFNVERFGGRDHAQTVVGSSSISR
jgi:hypothetical protein